MRHNWKKRGVQSAIGVGSIAAALAAAQVLTSGTAQAFDGPNGHHQFVQISTRASPTWAAHMGLWDSENNLVYQWGHGINSWAVGGKKTWWFTASKGSRIQVWVGGDRGGSKSEVRKTFWFEADSPDGYCFHVDPLGKVSYTGDSNTGGCTPD